MTSAINPLVPPNGEASTADVRANFLAARDEIETCQAGIATLASMPLSRLVRRPASWQLFNPPDQIPSAVITTGARRAYCWPFFAPRNMDFNEVGYRLNSAGGSTLHTAIYSNAVVAGADQPGDLLFEGTPIICAPAGVKTAPFVFSLPRGSLVWVAVMVSGNEQLYGIQSGGPTAILGWGTPSTEGVWCLKADLPSNAMPEVMPACSVFNSSYPAASYKEAPA